MLWRNESWTSFSNKTVKRRISTFLVCWRQVTYAPFFCSNMKAYHIIGGAFWVGQSLLIHYVGLDLEMQFVIEAALCRTWSYMSYLTVDLTCCNTFIFQQCSKWALEFVAHVHALCSKSCSPCRPCKLKNRTWFARDFDCLRVKGSISCGESMKVPCFYFNLLSDAISFLPSTDLQNKHNILSTLLMQL